MSRTAHIDFFNVPLVLVPPFLACGCSGRSAMSLSCRIGNRVLTDFSCLLLPIPTRDDHSDMNYFSLCLSSQIIRDGNGILDQPFVPWFQLLVVSSV